MRDGSAGAPRLIEEVGIEGDRARGREVDRIAADEAGEAALERRHAGVTWDTRANRRRARGGLALASRAMATTAPEASTRQPIVVYVGIEWQALPPSFSDDVRRNIRIGIEAAMAELIALGYDARWCGVTTDPLAAVAALRVALERDDVDCVLFGAGLRKTDAALVLFEQLVNVVHRSCPRAALCFNSTPEDSAAAVRRWF